MTTFDILVIGGGPAGVVAALTLQRGGYRVGLIARPRRLPAVEGLSERALAGLRFAGCQQALACIGSPVLRQACWNGERFAANQEWIVERAGFDQGLLQDAQDSGIVCRAGRVTGLRRDGGEWSIAGADNIRAGFLIDARGRASPHQRGKLLRGPITLALGQIWQRPQITAPGTWVAASAEGWAWFASLPSGSAVLQMFVSAEHEPLPPRARLADHYRLLLAACPETGEWLAGAIPVGAVFARYAHPQRHQDLLGEGYARVGDAAFAIDPLSGHGIYEAIGGALALASVVNTLLARPQDHAIATRFYEERITTDFLRLCRIGRDFYRQEQRWPQQPFWRERQFWPDDEPAHRSPDSAPPRIERRPVNVEGFITLQEVVVTPDHPRGVWQVAGIPLVSLLRYLAGRLGESMTAILNDYATGQGAKPDNCKTAAAWLASRGMLKVAAEAP